MYFHAAFLAADEAQKNGSEGIVEMRHILAAAEREYQKVQQPCADSKSKDGLTTNKGSFRRLGPKIVLDEFRRVHFVQRRFAVGFGVDGWGGSLGFRAPFLVLMSGVTLGAKLGPDPTLTWMAMWTTGCEGRSKERKI